MKFFRSCKGEHLINESGVQVLFKCGKTSGAMKGYRVVSLNRGTPIQTLKYYNPCYSDPQKGTPDSGEERNPTVRLVSAFRAEAPGSPVFRWQHGWPPAFERGFGSRARGLGVRFSRGLGFRGFGFRGYGLGFRVSQGLLGVLPLTTARIHGAPKGKEYIHHEMICLVMSAFRGVLGLQSLGIYGFRVLEFPGLGVLESQGFGGV